MREHVFLKNVRSAIVWTGSLMLAAVVVSTQGRSQTFTAEASVRRPDGRDAKAQLTATVDAFATDAQRDALVAAVKKGGTAARDLLLKQPDIGSLQVGMSKTAIKYAYERSTGTGRLITMVTAVPIGFVGGDLPDAKPKAGYDLGLVLIDIDPARPGHGEVAPAARVKIDAQGAIVTEDYGAEVVKLSNVLRK